MFKDFLYSNGRKSIAIAHQQIARALYFWPLLGGLLLALLQMTLTFFLP